ncbi:MAG: Gfo/Idh/MocA family oxidoreductase [Clostridiales bacterium]|nr:Gfo/Idh/MocA family oxidoreductase [Clostridiales bacterium]
MAKLKIGVFGAGRGMTMIHQLLGNPYADVAAICDKHRPTLDRAGKAAEDAGVKVELYERFDDFFNADMDAVVMANYAHEHAKFGIKLLNSGRHIMSEVLTCASLAEAVELIETVERTGLTYAYAENYCFFNTTYEMKQRYQRGDIGEFMYGEGEYIHDCSSIWPQITYGERDHWRNRSNATFYCTHSFGPLVYSTGLKPIKVQAVEGVQQEFMRKLGDRSGSFGVELITMENGGVVKSIHGGLKREPGSVNYEMYGTKGSMETDRWEGGNLHVYIEGDRNCVGEHTKYRPEFTIKDAQGAGHGGGDFFTTHYFIRSLLGDEDAKKNSIDVYMAVDMCIPGILGFRSILNGGNAVEIPNLRLKTERDKYRNDTFCAFEESAGDMFVDAMTMQPDKSETPDEVYAEVRRRWLAGEPG